jgi:hypothetical protein
MLNKPMPEVMKKKPEKNETKTAKKRLRGVFVRVGYMKKRREQFRLKNFWSGATGIRFRSRGELIGQP